MLATVLAAALALAAAAPSDLADRLQLVIVGQINGPQDARAYNQTADECVDEAELGLKSTKRANDIHALAEKTNACLMRRKIAACVTDEPVQTKTYPLAVGCTLPWPNLRKK